MPLFIDRHDLSGATAADIAAAHVKDLEVQDRFGVEYITYWFDYDRQHAFCLARGPDRDSVVAVHRESHGLLASEVIESMEETSSGSSARSVTTSPARPTSRLPFA